MEVSRMRNSEDNVLYCEIQMPFSETFKKLLHIFDITKKNNHKLLGQLADDKENDRENSNIPHVMGGKE